MCKLLKYTFKGKVHIDMTVRAGEAISDLEIEALY